jgi:hypothetical protein
MLYNTCFNHKWTYNYVEMVQKGILVTQKLNKVTFSWIFFPKYNHFDTNDKPKLSFL